MNTEKKDAISEVFHEGIMCRAIFDNMTEGIALHEVIYNDKGRAVNYRIMEVNPAYEKHTGIPSGTAKGRLATELYGTDTAPYLPLWAQVAETGKPHFMEVDFAPLKRSFSVTCCSPKKGWFATVFTDITERKRTEELLIQSEEKFRSLVETTSDWIWQSDTNGVCTYAGPQVETLLGYKPDEIVGKKPYDFMPAEDAERLRKALTDIIMSRKPYNNLPYKCRHKNGTIVILESSGTPLFDKKGKFIGFQGIDRDITERRRTEETLISTRQQLAASETQLRSIFDHAGEGILVADTETRRFVMANPMICKMLGYSQEELVSKSVSDIHPPESLPMVLATFEAQRKNKLLSAEIPCLRKDGKVTYANVTATPVEIEGRVFLVGLFLDVTERRQADRLLRLILNSIPDFVFWKDRNSVYQGCNNAFARVAGMGTPDNIVGKTDYDLAFKKEEADFFVSVDRRVMENDQAEYHIIEPHLQSDGKQAWLETCKVPLHNEQGEVIGVLGTYMDITERKQNEQELKESKIHLQGVLDSTAEGILAVDITGRVIYSNRNFAEMWHIPESIIVSGNDKELLSVVLDQLKDPEAFISRVKQLYNSDRKDMDVLHFKDGRIFERYSSPLILDERLVGRVWSFSDITRQKVAEDSILQLNRELEQRVRDRTFQLETANSELQAFAYSVSHDLRAPLRSINGFSSAIMEDYADKLDPAGRDYLERLRRASQRMGVLIDDLLKLSRVTSIEMNLSTVDLSLLAANIISDLRESDSLREVETIITPQITVKADPQLITTVMENLIGNAWKFTSKKRKAKIEFGVTTSDSGTAYYVRDNGAGFDMAFAKNLFGAFQRLHGVEDYPGDGIGLASAQRVIHRHGGRIWADAKIDEGATFFFTLGS